MSRVQTMALLRIGGLGGLVLCVMLFRAEHILPGMLAGIGAVAMGIVVPALLAPARRSVRSDDDRRGMAIAYLNALGVVILSLTGIALGIWDRDVGRVMAIGFPLAVLPLLIALWLRLRWRTR